MKYDTEIWITRVNWDKDYKHVVDFFRSGTTDEAKKNRQFSIITENAVNHLTHYSPIFETDGSGVVQCTGNHDNWVSYNYIVFKNPDFSNRYWYAFIDKVEYAAQNTTYVYFTIDIWQTYHLDTAFFDSWIDRSHISVADDDLGENLEPEPFSVKPITTRDISTIFSAEEWEPQWVLHSASYYNSETSKYEYSGVGEEYGNTFGEYGKYINSKKDLSDIIENYGRKSLNDICNDMQFDWQAILQTIASGGTSPSSVGAIDLGAKAAELQDHRDELIGLYAIPKWGKGSGPWADNIPVNKSQTLSVNDSLACGYVPRNKKMLSSVFKSYIIYARNGTMIAYKPEAFTGTPSVTCSCIPMGVSKYYMFMDYYGERDKQFIDISYRSERRVGYDNNTGLNKILNVINAGEKVIGSAAALATGVAAENPAAILSGAQGLIGSGVSMIDALGQHESHFGSNGELLDITGARATLRWADVSASYNECVHFDKFLTAYGYAQNTIGNLYSNMLTRSRFNYVKSSDANLRVNGNENVNQKMKNIFSNGVTIWHSINYMFDYDTLNN